EPAAPRPTPIIERIERTPPASESTPQAAVERTPPAIERIERTPPPPVEAEPEEPLRPQRRIVPNPDPPYQPPARPSTRRIVPTRSASSSTGRLSDRARENRAAPSAAANTPQPTPPPTPPSQQSRHGNTMIVTADNLLRIQTILSDL